MAKRAKTGKKTLQPITRVMTINLGKLTHSVSNKKKAPRAVKKIKEIASKMMKTKDVRVDVKLNKVIWSKGITNPPKRVRVKFIRKRNEDEDAKERLYTLVEHVQVDSLKGLLNENETHE